ncbi:lipopolysaccharide biosynthesis protein [Rathayibacter iranicus]|uniref:Uncharacterized protein n=2 Tax=Rathayibacter iranicus TaxID=59737 RepID=A0AAD1AG71_9MICO|nr:hypothetical protein [Rathayibacter iranicus]AZZ55631.1 hypothetical protein C7V51_06835 [Rathayibacter iranicus]MWV31108.1 hypothetical protein [Rathayibacter iranicus NCPPB 2253 = VKM Ac-1602]PPI61052.1 hypothetical protein C5E08_06815 [Rathayibacter iranicus]PPI72971.1 hypothetical protein C5E01_03835 [Rathayibacter iranicus]PWJ63944.1 O-antigen/teichoic acid export membrane protein [Rathayibacter iranicus NCPPB 2253 = VKM Ac-1602]
MTGRRTRKDRTESNALIRRLSGFTILPLISALSPFLLLPIVARLSTQSEWTVIAVGQSVGAFCGTLVYFGWNIVGPSQITLARSSEEQVAIYSSSFWSRIVILVPSALAGCAVTALLSGGQHLELGSLMCLSTLLVGMSGAWYAIGVGSPRLVATYEVLPRVAGILAAVPTILLLRNAIPYPVILLLTTLIGLVLLNRHLVGRAFPRWVGWRSAGQSIASNVVPTLVTSFGSVYTSAPVPLATGLFGATAVASVTSADKLYRYSLFVVAALANGLQSWVVGSSKGMFDRRFRASLLAHVVLGLLGAGGLVVLGDLATSILFGNELRSGLAPMIGLALAFLSVCTATPFVRYVLIPLNKNTSVLIANVCGLGIGVLSLLVTLPALGPAGVTMSLGVTEFGTLVGSMFLAVQAVRRAQRVGSLINIPIDTDEDLDAVR